jgi:hypothetical protein
MKEGGHVHTSWVCFLERTSELENVWRATTRASLIILSTTYVDTSIIAAYLANSHFPNKSETPLQPGFRLPANVGMWLLGQHQMIHITRIHKSRMRLVNIRNTTQTHRCLEFVLQYWSQVSRMLIRSSSDILLCVKCSTPSSP